MRLPRMTTRRWIVAVVIVALLMGLIVGGYRLKRRRDHFLSRVRHHDDMEFVCRWLDPITCDMLPMYDGLTRSLAARIAESRRTGDQRSTSELQDLRRVLEANRQGLARLPRGRAYHGAMARKYAYAAWHPWIAVEPDPPEPE